MKTYLSLLLTFILSYTLVAQEDLYLDWFTYYGGNEYEVLLAVEPTPQGDIVLAGYTTSTSGLATSNGWKTNYSGGYDDGFISKWSGEGNLLWTTYFGGQGFDHIEDLAITETGEIVGVGFTSSLTGIATSGAYQTQKGSNNDNDAGFICKYSPSGQLLWSTYLSGSIIDRVEAVTVDSQGHIYVVGNSQSPDMATENAFQTEVALYTLNGFIAKFSPDGELIWYTYFGGTESDQIDDIAIDNNNELVFLAHSRGSSGLASENAEQETSVGYSLILGKFDLDGQRIWSTYLDGEGDERYGKLAIDNNNDIIVAGRTSSLTGISTEGAFMETNPESGTAQFIAKYSNDGNKIWGTYLSTPINDQDIGDIRCMNSSIYYTFTGNESHQNFIIGDNPFQPVFNNGGTGDMDAILLKLSDDGLPVWGTYFGGNGFEVFPFIVPLNGGNEFIVAGGTSSSDFYGNDESWQGTFSGSAKIFLAQLSDLTVSLGSELDKRTDILLYPNPSNGSFTLSWDESYGDYGELMVINNIGQTVYKSKISSLSKIDLALPSGFYNVILEQQGRAYSKKIIIE